jgi:hypothetical protein
VQKLDCRLGTQIATGSSPDCGSVLYRQAVTWVIGLIGLHFLSDFKKDVELIVLRLPARHHALRSPLTRFTFLPGDRNRP